MENKDPEKANAFLNDKVLKHRESILAGSRAPKRVIDIQQKVGGRCEMVKGILWPDFVYKREKGEDTTTKPTNRLEQK